MARVSNSYSYFNPISNSYTANLNAARASQKVLKSSWSCCGAIQSRMGSAQFLNQYQFQMKGLSGAANKLRSLNRDSLWNSFSPKSSNTDVAEVYSEYSIQTKAEYDVNVSQLAQSQITQSNSVQSNGTNGYTDGNFVIELPNQSRTQTININTAGGTLTNREVQADIASQINNAGIGLNATVVENNGSSYLQIESKTGVANSFNILGSSDFTTTQDAKNLQYTLNKDGTPMGGGMVYQNESNENVKIDGYKITADFKKIGLVKIGVDIDKDKITKATEEFVEQYNETVKFLVDNAHRGTGVSRTLDNLMRAPISKDAMKSIGITMEENGLLTLDKEKFSKVLKNDSQKVYDILADNYSIADGVYQDVQRGLNTTTKSLINKDMEKMVFHNFHSLYPFNNYNPFGQSSDIFNMPLFFDTRA